MQPHLYLLRQDVQGQSLLINKECDHRSATICSQVFPPQFLLLQSLLIAGFCMENYTSKKAAISERPPTQPLAHPPPPVKCRCFSSRLQSRKNPHLDLLWHDILGQSLTEMHSDPWLDRPITGHSNNVAHTNHLGNNDGRVIQFLLERQKSTRSTRSTPDVSLVYPTWMAAAASFTTCGLAQHLKISWECWDSNGHLLTHIFWNSKAWLILSGLKNHWKSRKPTSWKEFNTKNRLNRKN